MSWSDGTATETLADVSAMLAEAFAGLPPDRMWMPFATYWDVFRRPVARRFAAARRRCRPSFARAWRRVGR